MDTGKQNRPYSAIDVSANLHNKVTKGAFRETQRRCEMLLLMQVKLTYEVAAAAKILKDLHEQKLIEGRTAGM